MSTPFSKTSLNLYVNRGKTYCLIALASNLSNLLLDQPLCEFLHTKGTWSFRGQHFHLAQVHLGFSAIPFTIFVVIMFVIDKVRVFSRGNKAEWSSGTYLWK